MLGTIVNSLAVVGGCITGLIVKGKLNEKISNTIMNGLALCVIYIGISGALKGEDMYSTWSFNRRNCRYR